MLARLTDPIVLAILLAAVALFVVLFLVLLIALWMKARRMEKKLSLFFSGRDGKDLESVLIEEKERVRVMDGEIQELFEISNRIHLLAQKSFHKSAVQRFNPFKEVGGNQSFAVSLLDGKNNGVVISSLHTREGTRVYAKPVKNGEADGFPLTEEEKATILEAKLSAREKKV